MSLKKLFRDSPNKHYKPAKITVHARRRFTERSDFSSSEQQINSKQAFLCGNKIHRYKEPFYSYLNERQMCCGTHTVKVYNEYVYIFANDTKKLVTVYPVPDCYLPSSDYLIKGNEVEPCIIRLTAPDGANFYINEKGGLTTDIALAEEFRTKQRAINHIKNNGVISVCERNGYRVVVIPM